MLKKSFLVFGIVLILVLLFAVKKSDRNILTNIKEGNMKLASVFLNGEDIPSKYTCDGEDISPELMIYDIPPEAKSLALIVDDPDAPVGTFVHWVLYNIPANTSKISSKALPEGAVEGKTDFGRIGWGGPCPPSGKHRYFFKLYAIDKPLNLPEGLSKEELEEAMKDNIIEKAELMGLYSRR